MSRIEVNGVTLNVTELPPRGRAAGAVPIVMIHGLAASQAFWYAAGAPVMAALGPCLLYDLRGHGRSSSPPTGYGVRDMARDLETLLDDRGIARAHLVAHSFGGMVAIAFALAHPERVASLVLADVRIRPIQRRISIPVAEVPDKVRARLDEMGLDIDNISRHDDGVGYLRTVARIEVEAGEEAAGLLSEIYRHPRLFRSRRNAMKWIELTERVSLVDDLGREAFGRDDLERLEMPILILVGGRSTTLASARELKRLRPAAILREIPDVGHFFPMSQPRLFLRPSLRFLRAVNQGKLEARLRARRRAS